MCFLDSIYMKVRQFCFLKHILVRFAESQDVNKDNCSFRRIALTPAALLCLAPDVPGPLCNALPRQAPPSCCACCLTALLASQFVVFLINALHTLPHWGWFR